MSKVIYALPGDTCREGQRTVDGITYVLVLVHKDSNSGDMVADWDGGARGGELRLKGGMWSRKGWPYPQSATFEEAARHAQQKRREHYERCRQFIAEYDED